MFLGGLTPNIAVGLVNEHSLSKVQCSVNRGTWQPPHYQCFFVILPVMTNSTFLPINDSESQREGTYSLTLSNPALFMPLTCGGSLSFLSFCILVSWGGSLFTHSNDLCYSTSCFFFFFFCTVCMSLYLLILSWHRIEGNLYFMLPNA